MFIGNSTDTYLNIVAWTYFYRLIILCFYCKCILARTQTLIYLRTEVYSHRTDNYIDVGVLNVYRVDNGQSHQTQNANNKITNFKMST